MSLELGKFAAAIVVAGVSMAAVSAVTNFVYQDGVQPQTRGFSIAVADAQAADAPAAAAPAAAVDPVALIAAADAAKGKDLTKPCAACHSFEKDGKNKVGPALWGVAGRNIASVAGFTYSADLSSKKAETWTDANLFHMISKPKDFAKGTKMAFPGIKDAEKAAAVVKYLQSLK